MTKKDYGRIPMIGALYVGNLNSIPLISLNIWPIRDILVE